MEAPPPPLDSPTPEQDRPTQEIIGNGGAELTIGPKGEILGGSPNIPHEEGQGSSPAASGATRDPLFDGIKNETDNETDQKNHPI